MRARSRPVSAGRSVPVRFGPRCPHCGLTALGLALCLLATSGASLHSRAAEDEALRRGIALFRQGDVRAAEPLLREAAESSPEDPRSRFYLGQLLLTQHRLAEAEKYLEKSLELRPDYAPLQYALAHLYVEQDRLTLALKAARRALELAPDSVQNHLQAAVVLKKLGRPREAVPHFSQVITLGASSEKMAYEAAVGLFDTREYPDATMGFEATIKFNPRNQRALDFLGACYRLKGWNEKAYEVYRRVLAIDPQDAIAYYGMGVIHAKRGETELAIPMLERSLAIDPDNGYAHYKLGKLRLQEGKTEEAVRFFERALELRPGLNNVRYNLGLAYLRLGDEKRGREALARFRELKAKEPTEMFEGGVRTAIPEDAL
ncbi:MAG: tetratricopeptide repeat protein [Acidobacteriota bacterium]